MKIGNKSILSVLALSLLAALVWAGSAGAAGNDFSISASPSTLSIRQGSTGSSKISTAVTSGSAQTVSFSVSGAPSGASTMLNPSSVTAGGSATLTINLSAGTPAGSYTIKVTGTGTSATHSTTVTLTVPNNDFSISASPSSLSLPQGSTGSSKLSTAVTSGSAQTVSFSVSGLPSGASATLNPPSVTVGGSATLTVNLSAGTPAGSYTVKLTGTGTSATHSTTVALTVTSAGSDGGIVNGGFEAGTLSGWTTSGAASSIVSSGCHTGAYCAQLGSSSPTSGNSSIAQTFTAPTGTSTLSFYYEVVCPDTLTFDWATATLADNTAGTTATVLPKTCTNPSSGWQQVTASVTAGHSYTLTLTSHDDDYTGDATYTLYDDVALSSSTSSGGGIVNGGFETGTFAAWTTSGASETITTTSHSGNFAAWLGLATATVGDSTVSQSITVPATGGTLTFWYANNCPDTVTYDWATVEIRNTSGTVLATPLAKTCASSYKWTRVTYNVASLAGQTVVLRFTNHDDDYPGDPTYTLYDDVAIS